MALCRKWDRNVLWQEDERRNRLRATNTDHRRQQRRRAKRELDNRRFRGTLGKQSQLRMKRIHRLNWQKAAFDMLKKRCHVANYFFVPQRKIGKQILSDGHFWTCNILKLISIQENLFASHKVTACIFLFLSVAGIQSIIVVIQSAVCEQSCLAHPLSRQNMKCNTYHVHHLSLARLAIFANHYLTWMSSFGWWQCHLCGYFILNWSITKTKCCQSCWAISLWNKKS